MKPKILVIFVAFVCYNSAVWGGSVGPSTNSIVANLKAQLDEARNKIDELTKSNFNGNSDSQRIISMLEQEITILRTQLNDINQNSTQTVDYWKARVQNLMDQLNELLEQYLPFDCIRDIEERRFPAAEQKLYVLSKNETVVSYIIRKVYLSKVERIKLLNDFGKSLTNIELTLMVYKWLAKYLGESTSMYPANEIREIVDLMKSVKSEVIEQRYATEKLKDGGEEVENNLSSITKERAVNEFLKAINANNFKSNSIVSAITEKLYGDDTELFFEVMLQVCSDVYENDVISPGKLLGNVYGINDAKNIGQISLGLAALFDAMESNGDSHHDAMVELAFNVKAMVTQQNYKYTKSYVKNKLDKLKDDMPSSLSAIAFNEEVCIRNYRTDEFLFASDYKYDGDRRHVFTWELKNEVRQGNWKLERYGEGRFSIKNVHYNEYLFSSNYYNNGAFTWVPGSNVIQNNWRIIPSYYGVKIVNNHNKGHTLKVSDDFYNQNRRKVEVPEMSENDWNSGAIWQIKGC